MEFSIQVKGLDKLYKKLGKATAQGTLDPTMMRGANLLRRWSQLNRLTGPRPQYLGVVSGRLKSSISVARKIEKENYNYYIGTNVVYAPIHEYGLTINKISSRRKSFKARYPARPFLRPAIENQENINNIVLSVNKAIQKALEE